MGYHADTAVRLEEGVEVVELEGASHAAYQLAILLRDVIGLT